MGYHPIESLMRTTMESLKAMVDVNTVVGDPVETKEGNVIIPVSRVSFGFVTGGGDESGTGGETEETGDRPRGGQASGQGQAGSPDVAGFPRPLPFTGGTGAGVSVRPVGFLVVGDRKVRFLPVDGRALYDRLIEEAPELLDRLADAVGCRRGGRDRGDGLESRTRRVEDRADERT